MRKTTVEDKVDDKYKFFKDPQYQKLFADYFYDKEQIKLETNKNEKNDHKQLQEVISAGTDKTTKVTTLNTVSKMS
jgi:hypothetical protein